MPLLFALTLCLGAMLVFSVQPMLARAVLPLLGGSSAVWTTCMVFFQAMLLAGYLYAHAIGRLAIGLQVATHAAVMALAAAFLPITLVVHATPAAATGATSPTAWLLASLVASAGVPFFVVASTAPLLQRWFSGTGHPDGDDPYHLYAASNLGSLLALVAYPLLVEPSLPMAAQGTLWAAGYAALGGLTVLCATAAWKSPRMAAADVPPHEEAPPLLQWLRWAWLAFIPSSLMLGVTTYLSTDIAPVPLLWVVPLALYLLSFILAFARRPIVPHSWMIRALPFEMMALALVLGAALVQPILISLHLVTLFTAAMVCHGELARLRPPVSQLTAFYVAIATGGALGGLFNGLLAPAVFDRIAEYPIALVLACLVLPSSAPGPGSRRQRIWDVALPAAIGVLAGVSFLGGRAWIDTPAGMAAVVAASGLVFLVCWTHRARPVRFALGIGAALLASGLTAGVNGRVLHQERNFFGVLQVTEDPVSNSHRLFHGGTLHGQQSLDPALRREPLCYFHRSGPIGQVFQEWSARHVATSAPARVAAVGLGAGSLAAYASRRERWTFYEIDPAVVRIARNPRHFTFLRDSQARSIEVITGDARIRLREAPARSYGLIVLDAFSSDAIPVHLLTREALWLYREKLAHGGLLALHISNRHVNFDPIVATLARDAGMVCRVRHDVMLSPEEKRSGKQPSVWSVMADRESDLGMLATDPRWETPAPDGGRIWTDDFSDLGRRLVFLRR